MESSEKSTRSICMQCSVFVVAISILAVMPHTDVLVRDRRTTFDKWRSGLLGDPPPKIKIILRWKKRVEGQKFLAHTGHPCRTCLPPALFISMAILISIQRNLYLSMFTSISICRKSKSNPPANASNVRHKWTAWKICYSCVQRGKKRVTSFSAY